MKKSIGPEAGSSETTLNMLKWWLVQAPTVNRASEHSMTNPRFEAFIPPPEVLDEQARDMIPPDDILRDDELDVRDMQDQPRPAIPARRKRAAKSQPCQPPDSGTAEVPTGEAKS